MFDYNFDYDSILEDVEELYPEDEYNYDNGDEDEWENYYHNVAEEIEE